jgi:hypothetical protein
LFSPLGDVQFGEQQAGVVESLAGSIGDASLHFSQQDEGTVCGIKF